MYFYLVDGSQRQTPKVNEISFRFHYLLPNRLSLEIKVQIKVSQYLNLSQQHIKRSYYEQYKPQQYFHNTQTRIYNVSESTPEYCEHLQYGWLVERKKAFRVLPVDQAVTHPISGSTTRLASLKKMPSRVPPQQKSNPSNKPKLSSKIRPSRAFQGPIK